MAAAEAINTMYLRPVGRLSIIDARFTRLPYDRPEITDFDPREHRAPASPISPWMAYFNLLRTVFGAGLLGMPLAISQAGIVLGPIMTCFTGILIIHTHICLLWCLNEVSRQLRIPYISYRYGFRLALLRGPPLLHCLGHHGPTIVAVFMLFSQIGICTVFVIFTTDSLRDLMDWQDSRPALLTLFFPYLIMEILMKNLKRVSYVSMFGNLLNLIGLLLVFYQIFESPHGEYIVVATTPLPILFAMGSNLFNMSAVAVSLSLDKALKNPKVMTKTFGVLSIGIMVPTLISTVFGTLGYWSFGTMEENILRSLPFHDLSSLIAIGLYMVAIALAYPIQCYPGIAVFIEVVKNHDPKAMPSDMTLKAVEYVFRPIFVSCTFLIAYWIPYQGAFVAFVGNLCTTQLALVFPALMEICLLYPNDYGKYKLYLVKDLLIIALGLISWFFGIVLCGYLIYVRLNSGKVKQDDIFL